MSTSDEVAADFKDALQDLKVNSRPEISNLTIIAKENTEHAQAISRELENHIRTTRPEWKLPALYVLDSIVKNVGTPYTVFLGRNLYRTFMDAYLVMDQGHRRAMDGLLKTWKQPVPESLDTRPVFSSEVTRDIENALIKFRTVAVQQQAFPQRPAHGLPPRPPTNPMGNAPWRETPTPPQSGPRYMAPNDPRGRQPYPPGPQYGQYPGPPPATPPTQYPPPQQYPPPVSSVDLDTIKADLAKLILSTKTAWALDANDTSIQHKLKALLDLETILKTQTLPPQQLHAVRSQIQALSPSPAPQPTFPPPASVLPPVIQSPQQAAVPTFPPPPFPPASTPVNLAQILANAQAANPLNSAPPPPDPTPSLADLLRRVSSPMQSSYTPTAVSPFVPPPSLPLPPAATQAPVPTPTTNLAELLAQFNKPAAALTTSQPIPAQPTLALPILSQPPATGPAPGTPEWLLSALKGLPIPASGTPVNSTPLGSEPMTRQVSATTSSQKDVELSTASMKMPRLHLIKKLYEAYPNICATCGRRFEATAQGKEKKARHMDWHFKVKDPDAAKRGIHRSWFIGEKEWIEYREADETSPAQVSNGAQNPAAYTKQETKDKYVPVPPEGGLSQPPCPICQEKFEPKWHVEANDFVFMDAVRVNAKIYHATCWEEYSKGQGIVAPGTPDSVLGKRKAEVGGTPSSGKKVRAY